MAKKIAIRIRKGGSGKTTTAVNLATALHQQGKKTLLVDLDSQANATTSVGINPLQLERTINSLLMDSSIGIREVIKSTEFGLDVLPSHPALAQIEMNMRVDQVHVIKGLLQQVDQDYDYIIMDTPPAESFLTVAALTAADEVIIPLESHFLALYGLEKAMHEIDQMKQGLNPTLKIAGILPTKAMMYTNLGKLVIGQVISKYPDLVFPIVIRYSTKVGESPAFGRPIVIQSPTHPAALGYINLAKLLIGLPYDRFESSIPDEQSAEGNQTDQSLQHPDASGEPTSEPETIEVPNPNQNV